MPSNPPADCVSLLQAMIAVDTVTPHASGRAEAEQPLADLLATYAASWGFEVRRLPVDDHASNLLLLHETSADLPWRVFDSHLDTVDVVGMTIDPFGGVARDGKVYGRGACDTKGTGAAMLWAAKQAIAAGTLACNVALLFSVGEEHYQIGARSFVENDLPSFGWLPEAVIVGEPTQMNVVAASNGFLRWRVVTHGKATHSSAPELGHNAVTDMAHVVLAIESEHIERLDARHELTGRATCSINGIQGGVQHNIVPDRCEIQVDQRLIPGENATDVLNAVTAILERLQRDRQGMRFEFKQIETAPPFSSASSLELGERVASLLGEAKIEAKAQGAPYTTNANHYAPAGLPCVVLGPGDIAQAHTDDEWISLDQLELGVQGYRVLMEGNL